MELSSLIADVRIAADVLEADQRTPPEAAARLRALLGDYERAAARLDRPEDRPGISPGARRARRRLRPGPRLVC
jgi:hypothetical protein